MKNRRMRTRMYGGVRGRKTKKVGRNSKIFVFLLLDLYPRSGSKNVDDSFSLRRNYSLSYRISLCPIERLSSFPT